METWNVTYLVRNVGAIGKFWPKEYTVEAETDIEARAVAFDRAHAENLETLHYLACNPKEKEPQA